MSSRNARQLSRRAFLDFGVRTAVTGAIGTAGMQVLPRAGAKAAFGAAAAAKPRRHLVNLIGGIADGAGWDSSWFHNALALSDVVYGGSGVTSTTLAGAPAIAGMPRFTPKQNDADMLTHPLRGDVQFGVGMTKIFGGANADLFRKMLVWRGLNQAGGHGVGNSILLNGTTSSYALSYSAIIAQGIGQNDYERKLHYVVLAPSPASAFLNSFNNTGFAVPLGVPGYASLKGLTSVAPTDFQDTRRALIESAVSQITASLTGQAKLSASQAVLSSFDSQFAKSISLAESSLALKWEFVRLWAGYCLAAQADLSAIYAAAGAFAPAGAYQSSFSAGASSYTAARATVQGHLNTLQGAIAAAPLNELPLVAASALLNWLQVDTTVAPSAFQFALAEYLVMKDLSAVVDVGLSGFDYHSDYPSELAVNGRYFSMLRMLLANLNGASALTLEGGALPSGKSVLDQTMVVMHTEMDRNPFLNLPGSTPVIGTDHDTGSASLLLAGYGINQGAVVGGIARPAEAPNFADTAVFGPLAIDPATGYPTPVGQLISTASVFPTLIAAFGFQVPAQQLTDAPVVPVVLAKQG